ncbi:hypothetical protein ACWATR_12310 [Nostoc sp. UIC 10890]
MKDGKQGSFYGHKTQIIQPKCAEIHLCAMAIASGKLSVVGSIYAYIPIRLHSTTECLSNHPLYCMIVKYLLLSATPHSPILQ